MTVEELFKALAERLDTKAAAGINRTIQWNITDLDPGVWAFRLHDGKGELVPGGVEAPDATFLTTSDTWVGIAEGRIDAMRAFMTGKLRVQGDMMLALKVPKLFPTGT